MTTAIPAAKASVSRALSGSRNRRTVAEPVPDSPHGLERLLAELRAQAADVDVDDVRVALVRVVPDVIDEPPPRERLARVAHEVLQDRELLGGELERLAVQRGGVRRRVELEPADGEQHRPRPRS